MIRCTFAGHREVRERETRENVRHQIENLIMEDDSIVFYCGGMGEFDGICAGVVRELKRKYKEKDISLCLVEPYMKQSINTEKEWLELQYDEIIIPIELAGVYYKKAITERNKWMIDQSMVVIAYVNKNTGGAATALKYAEKKGKIIRNLAIM